jgi:hypothetical protein
MKNPCNRTLAAMESRIDHLETELAYLHTLLIDCGFPEGIITLKETAEELLSETSPTSSRHPASSE